MSTRSFWTGGALAVGGVAGSGTATWIAAATAAVLVMGLVFAELGPAPIRRAWRSVRRA
jgi:hypothetical protein